jgi:hypothetical protein
VEEVSFEKIDELTKYKFSNGTSFSFYNGSLDYKEFSLYTENTSFYADNIKLFPLDVFSSVDTKDYILSLDFPVHKSLRDGPRVFNKNTNEISKFIIRTKSRFFLIDSASFINPLNETVFTIEFKKLPFSTPRLFVEGNIDNKELELFVVLLWLFV